MLSEWLKHLYVCPNIYGPYCIRRIIVYATKAPLVESQSDNDKPFPLQSLWYHSYFTGLPWLCLYYFARLIKFKGDWIDLVHYLSFFYQISTKYQLFKILSSVVHMIIDVYIPYLLTLWKYIWCIYNSYLVRVLFLHISVVCMAGFSAMIHTDSFLCPH